jgi:trk system potassium uptake protein
MEQGYEYILIAGCSRLGASIASMFSSRGKEVVVLDLEEKSFKSISGDYSGFSVVGDATDIDVLKEAGAEKADLLVAATDDDNTNIMISEIAKNILGIPKVISRIYDTEKEIVYREFSIDTIEPFELTLSEFERLIGGKYEKKD